MKMKIRFPNTLIWGSIALLLFAITGCSFPADPASEPPSQEETEESREQDSGDDSENEDGENEGQEDPEDEDDNEGEKQNDNEKDKIPAFGDLVIRIGEMAKSEGVYPDLSGVTWYLLDFSAEDGGQAESLYLETGKELTVTLNAGEWEIRSYGVMERGTGQQPLAVISGTARATVYENKTESVLIVPDGPAAENGEQGFLSWNIDYPGEKIWGAVLTVSLKIDGDSFVPYRYFDLTAPDAKEQKISLPAGTYKMESRFLSHNVDTRPTEIVHIFPGLETGSSRVTIAGDLFPNTAEFSTVDELKTYLTAQPENTVDNPYPVKIAGADLSSKEGTGETLKTLYKILSRYVTLDLRGCTGTELIAASTSSLEGRKKIVSLILPESITGIAANGFSGYESLKSVIMPQVKTIGTSTFKSCKQLEVVSAPALETVADAKDNSTGAFAGCTVLKTLYCPMLVTLGNYAFYGCTGLTEAAFPNLRTVGELAFKGCTALKSINLPAVTKIDKSGFENDTALTYLIFRSMPPELGENVFKGGDFSQSGVIYVPPDAVDAYKNTTLPNWPKLTELVKPLSGLVDI
ncbi:MAG: leucine-rich repeat domain-containing protein [Treponema sp.]|jgi:hypothetical protein|nr:leucine-rich repeat domain-containing protein [Treponema sp.]